MLNTEQKLEDLYSLSKDFIDYHKHTLPLCAAENIISPFANIPLDFGFQERYIMNNTYSFNLDDNFVGCEKLLPFYQRLSSLCHEIFGADYTDPRPFTGMHCLDMIAKTICRAGDKIMILGKEYGGHASVKPVVERLGISTVEAPYDMGSYDLDYEAVNRKIHDEKINYILLAPSDLIKPLDVENIDTESCVLLWDCSQIMGLIAAGLCSNPLRTKKNVIMFGGTHKTFPGPASGLILTNDKNLHNMMETEINPKYLRNSQMHQKISLLFALTEFQEFGRDYMKHMLHCSNYLGLKLRELGFNIGEADGEISRTHQIFMFCNYDETERIYNNAYKFGVTLNKKHKELFHGYGIRLGTQEIARYKWDDNALDTTAEIISCLIEEDPDSERVNNLMKKLPKKRIHYAYDKQVISKFLSLTA